MNRSADWRTRLQKLLSDYVSRQAEIKAKARADGVKIDRIDAACAWQAELVDNGLAGPGWPSLSAVSSFHCKITRLLPYARRRRAYPRIPARLSFIVAPTLIKHGTASANRFLTPLLRADDSGVRGFRSPARAATWRPSSPAQCVSTTLSGYGQKIWTTMADRADWMFAW